MFAGASDLDVLFEDGKAPAIDAEYVEEPVPEALRFFTLRAFALPLPGKPESAVFDLVPR